MNILITGAAERDNELFGRIESLGNRIMFQQFESEELVCGYDWAEGIICNGLFLYHRIDRFNNLKYIQLTSSGTDRLSREDLKYIAEKKIILNNAKGVYSIPIAEFVFCGVLQLYKHSREFYENQKKHLWVKNREIKEIFGKKICILGAGSIGSEIAKRFSAFGATVYGVDTFCKTKEYFSQMYPAESLKTLLKDTDIFIISVPLTEETDSMIKEEHFSVMKNTSIVVNVSRGAVIEKGALENAIDRGEISGAVIDVFEREPMPESCRLWGKSNVIITPHNSFIGENNKIRLSNLICDNLRRSEVLL